MSDVLLWRQLKAGNKQALETIYRTHAADLIRYGSKFSKDQQLVEDSIQDLFIELWQNRAGLSETDSIRRYLLVAIRRKIIRQGTKISKTQLANAPQDYDFDVVIAIDESIIAEELSQQQAAQLQKAIATLSKRQREAIYLKYQLGMDYKDICAAMEISYQSARNLVAGALKKMKQQLSLGLLLWWLLG